MKKILGTLLSLALLAAILFFVWKRLGPDKISLASHLPPPVPSEDRQVAKYPVPPLTKSNATQAANTALQDDQGILDKLNAWFPGLRPEKLFELDGFLHRFVVFVANADGPQIPRSMSPFKDVPGHFLVTGQGDSAFMSPKNENRYKAYLRLLLAADLKGIVQYYREIYPALQSMYNELGTKGYFNDKLVAVIDEAIATPEVQPPIPLIQQSVRCQFADSGLESRSAIQKMVLRLGPHNAKTLKARLHELRILLTQPTK